LLDLTVFVMVVLQVSVEVMGCGGGIGVGVCHGRAWLGSRGGTTGGCGVLVDEFLVQAALGRRVVSLHSRATCADSRASRRTMNLIGTVL